MSGQRPGQAAEKPGEQAAQNSAGRIIWQPVLAALMWLFLRIRVRNGELLPRRGAGVAYYNHIHWLDPVLICGTIRRYAVPLTKIEARRWPVVGYLLRWYHVIFISRGSVDRAALQATWDVLADGDISVISPEGTRSVDGRWQAAKEGLAYIVQRAPDAWLMPCAVTGTPAFKWQLRRLWDKTPVLITYGRPFRFRWPAGKPSRDVLRKMTEEAMIQLAVLLPTAMRGDYAGCDPDRHEWLEFLEE